MKREIKFRGKSKGEIGRWFYGYYHYDKHLDAHYICDPDHLFRYEVIGETVGQLTGLLDKNGVEIYESDIIQKIFPGTSVFTKPKMRGVVAVVQFGTFKVCDDSFGLEYFATGWFFEYSDKSGTASLTNEFEVIGNVFEHPELIKQTL